MEANAGEYIKKLFAFENYFPALASIASLFQSNTENTNMVYFVSVFKANSSVRFLKLKCSTNRLS